MLPGLNFNPSFANLSALHGMGGPIPHPIRPGIENPWQGAPMPGPMPGGSPPIWGSNPLGTPPQGSMPVGIPGMDGGMPPGMPGQGNFGNLQAIMQLLQQRGMY